MNYDPIKKSLGVVFNTTPFFRKIFYVLLDLLLLRAWHIQKELRTWKKTFPADAFIIDAGAGFGQYVYFMSKLRNTWSITGIDVKKEQVDDCNNFFETIGKKQNVRYIEGDLTQYVSEQKANAIVCVDVMEHIEEDVQVFKNFRNSLKSNGVLLISTPSDKGGSDVHDEHEESFVGEHVRDGYNINEIQEKILSAGFSKVEARYSYGIPGKISWKLSMKYPILLVNISKVFFVILPFYYCLIFPFCLILNYLDLQGTHKEGTGLIVKAIA